MHDLSLSWVGAARPHEALAARRKDGSLQAALPEVARLYGVPQNSEHHPEVCTGAHIELCLHRAEQLGLSLAARIAVLLHDLGKGLTPASEWPRHLNHEAAGVPEVETVAERFKLNLYTRKLCLTVCRWHLHAHRLLVMRSTSIVSFMDAADLVLYSGFRRDFVGACTADATGRLGLFDKPYPQATLLEEAGARLSVIPRCEAPRGTAAWQKWHGERLAQVRAAKELVGSTTASTSCD